MQNPEKKKSKQQIDLTKITNLILVLYIVVDVFNLVTTIIYLSLINKKILFSGKQHQHVEKTFCTSTLSCTNNIMLSSKKMIHKTNFSCYLFARS